MSKSGADESTFDEAEKQMHLERYEWIAGILFQQMDADGDDYISLDEFVEAYFVEQRRLGEEIEELNLRIQDAETRAA